MQLDIIATSSMKPLRRISHDNQLFAEAPPTGEYTLRLTNNSPSTRMAIVSVDGVNVIDGKDASYEGGGYVLRPWQSVNIKGWMRSHSEVAAFTFQPSEASYAAATGRGTKNAGVIGVAVFDEKPKWTDMYQQFKGSFGGGLATNGYGSRPRPAGSRSSGGTKGTPATSNGGISYSAATSNGGISYSAEVKTSAGLSAAAADIGTGYGQALTQHTQTVAFEKATASPVEVLTIRYAVTEMLRSWGVPVDVVVPPGPNAFPAQPGFVEPPPGWTGR